VNAHDARFSGAMKTLPVALCKLTFPSDNLNTCAVIAAFSLANLPLGISVHLDKLKTPIA
jgi:hypothetical protein